MSKKSQAKSSAEIITNLFVSIAQRNSTISPESMRDWIIACFEELGSYKVEIAKETKDICNKIMEEAL